MGGTQMFELFGAALCVTENYPIEEISCASAGAIVGFLLSCDVPLEEIKDTMFTFDLKSVVDISLKSLLNNYGLSSLEPLKKVLKEQSGDPKFSDVTKYKLHIPAYCFDTCKTVYFSRDTHPDMSIVDAVIMSCSIPIFFVPVQFQGHYYMDGGTIERIPDSPFALKDPASVIVLEISLDIETPKDFSKIQNFFLHFFSTILLRQLKSCRNDYKTVTIPYRNCLNFSMSHEEKLQNFMKGYSQTFYQLINK